MSDEKSAKRRKRLPHKKDKVAKSKKRKTERAQDDFNEVKFKFFLRDPETTLTGLQKFLEHFITDHEDKAKKISNSEGLALLKSYLLSSSQCTEVLNVLSRPQKSSQEVHAVFQWLRIALKECKEVMASFSEVRQHIVNTLFTKHTPMILNSLRQGNRPAHLKTTLLLLADIVELGYKYARLILIQFDFNHRHLPHLLLQRDRKDPCDVRSSMMIFLMRLLLIEDLEITKTLVDQKVLLQETLKGLAYDRSEYVRFVLTAIHDTIVTNEAISKTAKVHLFSTPVLREVLALYQWPGPTHWKSQPSELEKRKYTSEQMEVADILHAMLIDLCATHKPGICFNDKTLGSTENKNPAMTKLLETLLTSYIAPKSHKLALAILKACPDQVNTFLKQLYPHLVPRSVDTWITCIQFFKQIIQNHVWPSTLTDPGEGSDRISQLVHFLFPPENIINTLKDGLHHSCPTVQHQCLQALLVIMRKGQHFRDISSQKFGDNAPLTQAVHGFTLKVIPTPHVLLHVLHQMAFTEKFSIPIIRDLYKDTEMPLPHVTRFEHLVTLLKTFCAAPHLLNSGPSEMVPLVLSLLAEVTSSSLEIDMPPTGMSSTLPALCLLQAFSACDVRKLSLFGEPGNKGEKKVGLLQKLIALTRSGDAVYGDAAQRMVVKILLSTGLFEGHEGELHIWLRHLECSDDALSSSGVVTFLVDILHQYIVNPYPANDQLMEMMDEEDDLCMDKTALSHSFSPLGMLALKSSVHSSENVQGYICQVLVDILHSLHDSRAFIKVVHALSQQLDLHVIGYVVLHASEEPFSWNSVEQSLNDESYLSHLKGSKTIHPGLLIMRRVMKESEEEVPERAAEVVAEVSTRYCLPLLQQSLCYIHKIVCLSSKSLDVSNNRKLTQVCIEFTKAVLHRMRASSKATKSSETTKGSNILEEKKYGDSDEVEDDGEDCGDSEGENSKPDAENKAGNSVCKREMLSLMNNKYCVSLQKDANAYSDLIGSQPGQVADSFTESLCCLLQHPLSRWVFSQGFRQHDTDFEWLVSHYCSILLEVLDQRNAGQKDDLTAIAEGCRQQMWLALKDYDEIPEGLLPLLGKCVEVLFSASGHAQSVSALFRLLRLPQKCFVVQTTMRLKVTDLCRTLVRLAENANTQPELMSNVLEAEEFSVEAVEQLFDLVSILKDAQLELLALNCLKMSPALAVACTDQTWQRMLNDFVEMNAIQRELFEKFLMFSPMCRLLCSKWIQENHTMLGEKDACLPMMLVYLQLTSRMREDAAEDPTVQVIADIFHPCLNEELLPLGGMALQIISTLINCGVYGLQAMHEAKEKVVRLATNSAQLLAGHFHILAAVLRQEAVSSGNSKNKEMNNGQHQTADSWNNVLVACLRYLTTEPMTSSNGWQGSKESMECLVELLSALLSQPIRSAKRGTVMGFLPVLVKSCLKYHYKNPKILVLLRKLVIALFAKGETGEHVEKQVDIRFEEDGTSASFDPEREETSEDVLSTVHVNSKGAGASTKSSAELELFSEKYSSLILDFFSMCVGHSEFLMVMKGGELQVVKDELVWLLVMLQQLEKKCCSVLSYNILMAAYGASLSLTDQRILFLVAACEKYGGSNRKFRPVLWGDAAVSYFEVQQHIGPSLIGTLQLKQVVDHIDPSIMEASVLHFPLLRTADGKQTESAEKLMSQACCYDPCFFLPLFCHFLGPEHVVEIRPFINNNCLGLVLAALSSHEAGMRKLAFLALANLYAHIEGAHRLPEKSLLLAFLELLRNSLTKENQKLSCIISLFLARAVKIISDPGHNMYCAIQSFLLLKPALDVSNVPEFYKFFNSAIPLERSWLLQLLQDGLRETSDHRVFERRYFFKLVTSHISSSLGDVKTVRGALQVLIKGCSIATVAKDWVVEHGLLPWLTSFIRDYLRDTAEDCQLISQVLHQLWFTTSFGSSRVWWLSLPGLARNLLKSSILACIHLVLSKSSALNKQSLEWLLRILHNSEQPNLSAVTQPTPSLVAMAMWHLGHLGQRQEAAFAAEVARQLSFCHGFHLPSSAHANTAGCTGKRKLEKLDSMTHATEKDNLAYVRSLTLSLLLECDLTCHSGNSGMAFSASKAAMVETAWTAAKWVLSESHCVESGSKLLTLVTWVDKVLTYIVECGEGDGERKLKLIERLPSFLTNLLSSYAAMAETLKPGLPYMAPTSKHCLFEAVAQHHKHIDINIYTTILEQLVSYWCFRCSREKQEQKAGHASCGKQTQWQGCLPYAAVVACLNKTVVHVLDIMHQSTENDKLQTSPHLQGVAPFWDVIHWCQSSDTKLHQEVLLAGLVEACLKRTAPASALIMMKIVTSGDKKPKDDKREDSAKTPKLRKGKRKSLNRKSSS